MPRTALWVVALLAVSAGCLGAQDPTEPDPAEPAGEADAEPAPALEREVYEFEGNVSGQAPPHPTEDGAASEEIGPAQLETFQVPEGAANLTVEAEIQPGTGSAQVEIVGPEDQLVWGSREYRVAATVPGGPSVSNWEEAPGHTDAELVAGEHEVRYHVAGEFGFDLEVTVDPAPPQP